MDLSELESRSFMLSWQDGVVESACFHKDDPAWVANIKRGMASMLQHTPQFLEVSQNNVIEVINLETALMALHKCLRRSID